MWGPPNEVCPAYGNTCPCYPNQCGGPCANSLPSLGACPISENVTFTPINLCANGSITFTVRQLTHRCNLCTFRIRFGKHASGLTSPVCSVVLLIASTQPAVLTCWHMVDELNNKIKQGLHIDFS